MALLLSSNTRTRLRNQPDVRGPYAPTGAEAFSQNEQWTALFNSFVNQLRSPQLTPGQIEDVISAESAFDTLRRPLPSAGQALGSRLPGFQPTGFLQEAQAGGARPPRFAQSAIPTSQAALGLLGAAAMPFDVPRLLVQGGLAGVPEAIQQRDPRLIAQNVGEALAHPGEFRGIDIPGISSLPDRGVSVGPVNLTPKTVAGGIVEALADPLTYAGAGAVGLGPSPRFLDDIAPTPSVVRGSIESISPGRLGYARPGELPLPRSVGGRRPMPVAAGGALDESLEEFRRVVRDERLLRNQGIPQQEIRNNLSQMAGQLGDAFQRAVDSGATGADIRAALNEASPRGTRRSTFAAGAEIGAADLDEAVLNVAERTASGEFDNFEALRLIGTEGTPGILDRAVRGEANITPGDLDLLARFAREPAQLSDEAAEISARLAAFDAGRNIPPGGGGRPPRGRSSLPGGGGPPLPPSQSALPTPSRRRPAAPRPESVIDQQERYAREAAQRAAELEREAAAGRRMVQEGLDIQGRGRMPPNIPVETPGLPPSPGTRGRAVQQYRPPGGPPSPPTSRATEPSRWSRELVDAASFVRSLWSAFDLSGLRQTATFAYRRPRQWSKNFVQSLKAAAKEENFQQIMDDLANRGYRDLRERAGVRIDPNEAQIGRTGTIASQILNAIPGYAQSQRAYASLVLLSRDDMFRIMLERYGADLDARLAGRVTISDDELKAFGRLSNVTTGSGDLLPDFIKDSRFGNTPVLWAPRLLASRVELPWLMFSRNPAVRREAAEQLAAFIGINMSALLVGEQFGMWEVEKNPRSAAFGQFRVGNQLIDPWFGFRPLVVTTARLISGQSKSATDEQIFDINRQDAFVDFWRSKLTPEIGAGINIWNGQDQFGRPYGLSEAPGELLVPLIIKDVVDALTPSESGDFSITPGGVAGPGLAVLGFGATTIEQDVLDEAALREHGQHYDELTPSQRDAIDQAHPEAVERRSQERIQRGGALGDYEARKRELAMDQIADDALLNSTEPEERLTREEWIDRYKDRQLQLREAREALSREFGDGQAGDAPWQQYFAKVDEFTVNGFPDWDRVNAWLASQDESFIAAVDQELGVGGATTEVRRYRSNMRSLDQSGWWDIKDEAWADFKDLNPEIDWTGVPDDYWKWREQEAFAVQQELIADGVDPDVALQRARDTVSTYKPVQVFNEYFRTEYRHGWVTANPDLARIAWGYGLFSPDKAETEFLNGDRQPVRAP